MLEEVAPTCKSPPCSGFEPISKAARSEREDSLSFEKVLERKKKDSRASREPAEATAAAAAAQVAPPPVVVPPQVEPPAVEGESEEPVSGPTAPGTAAAACPPNGVQGAQAANVDGDAALSALAGGAVENCPVVASADLQAASASLMAGIPGQAAAEQAPADPADVQQGIDAILAAAQNVAADSVKSETTEIKKENVSAAGAQSAAQDIDAAVVLSPATNPAAAVKPAESGIETYLERAKEAQPKSAPSIDQTAQAQSAASGQASRPEMPVTAAAQEPARTAEASQSLLQQMTKNIQMAATQNGTTMRIHLNPHELGSIDIRLVSNQNGVGIMMLAEKAATGHLLESQMGQLQQAVLNAGVQVSQLWVGQNPQSDTQASLFPEQRSDQPANNGREQGFSTGQKGNGQGGQARKAARYSMIDYRA